MNKTYLTTTIAIIGVLAAMMLAFAGTNSPTNAKNEHTTKNEEKSMHYVSMHDLIANGEKYNNKYVSFFAISSSLLQYNENLLYPDPFSYCMILVTNAVAIDTDEVESIRSTENRSWDGDMVWIEGKYIHRGVIANTFPPSPKGFVTEISVFESHTGGTRSGRRKERILCNEYEES